MKTITVEGQLRTEFGKSAARKIRAQKQVPGVIYGRQQTPSLHFTVSAADIKPLIYTADFQLLEMKLGNATYRCVLKDLQFDKVTDELIHFDLLELQEDKKITVSIPLKLEGTPAGVRIGGRLIVKMKALKVKTLPKYLQESIVVNIEHLQLNGNIRVEDVQAVHYDIINSPRIPIASVVLTRQLKQQDSEARKEAAKK